eukprot:TRINITY_DN67354_c5_g2_i1.p1 TRINITY_DN67354_c5_g2~~TRINITY_DN67354_c5_g2_i1.p1  ORF type:complete len:303 (-),score=21.33 TRINITY_DN67354_c5_g2_i1:888-1796(-)
MVRKQASKGFYKWLDTSIAGNYILPAFAGIGLWKLTRVKTYNPWPPDWPSDLCTEWENRLDHVFTEDPTEEELQMNRQLKQRSGQDCDDLWRAFRTIQIEFKTQQLTEVYQTFGFPAPGLMEVGDVVCRRTHEGKRPHECAILLDNFGNSVVTTRERSKGFLRGSETVVVKEKWSDRAAEMNRMYCTPPRLAGGVIEAAEGAVGKAVDDNFAVWNFCFPHKAQSLTFHVDGDGTPPESDFYIGRACELRWASIAGIYTDSDTFVDMNIYTHYCSPKKELLPMLDVARSLIDPTTLDIAQPEA